MREVPLAEMFGYATDLRSRDPGPGDLQHGVRQVQRSARSIAEAIIKKQK
jgi:translation elongation factor EF-G